MRAMLFSLLGIILIISCKEENDSLLPKYQELTGTWYTQYISFDSSGVRLKRSIDYDTMVIRDDLTYRISLRKVGVIENGYVRIVSQSGSQLKLFFEAHYPMHSSFAGSHLFSNVDVSLVKLTPDTLILRDVENKWWPAKEYLFVKN